ncbi:hypothetical protein BKI52_03205 [marine bacterium AO1-C]|nr:hypothetical protein BKI52_03205 [marine bacterium AO1-C]
MESIKFKYGILKLSEEVDNEYFWTGPNIKSTSKRLEFQEDIPVCVFTTEKQLAPALLQFIEKILSNVGLFLEKAMLYLKSTLQENPTKYNIKDDELPELELDIDKFPVDLPTINFYENNEWMIRFATGRFHICDPYGIAVFFKESTPISIEDLSENEMID